MAFRTTRREFLKRGAAATVAGNFCTVAFAEKPQEKLPPVRTLTQGPKHH